MLTFTFTIWPLLAHTTKLLWGAFTNSYFQKVSKFNFQILWGADNVALKCLPQLAGHQVPKKSSLPQMSHYLTVLLKYLNICTFPLPDVRIFWYFWAVRYFDIWNPCRAVKQFLLPVSHIYCQPQDEYLKYTQTHVSQLISLTSFRSQWETSA